jgi:adenylylsulfate kinase
VSWALWITGRPGSGKTTLTARVSEALRRWPVTVKVLDLAEARRAIVGRAWSTEAEEELVHRALALTAKLLTEAGVVVMMDATAPRRAWRDTAREWITHFAEVQLVCPADLCAAREQGARWGLGGAHGGGGATTSRPDFAPDYEESLHAELTLHTHGPELVSTVEEVLLLARRLHRAAASATTTGRERP